MQLTKIHARKDAPAVTTKAGSVAIQLKELSDDGEFEGYGSTFGNVDRGMDVVEKGAFRRTIKEKPLSAIKMLRDHDSTKIVGQWLSLEEDDHGLKVRGRLFAKPEDAVPLGRETYTLMKMGALDALSIGYRTIKSAWDEQRGIRSLLDVDLWEISVVTFPMNEMATVDAVKGDLALRDVERILREGGAPAQFAKMVAIHGFDEAKKRLGSRREGGSSAIAEMIRKATTQMQKG